MSLKINLGRASLVLLIPAAIAYASGPEVFDTSPKASPQPGQIAASSQQDPNASAQQAPNTPRAMNLPNTISAPPFTMGDKFEYRVVQTFGLRGLLGSFVTATVGQASGTPYAWGGGVEGYAKRYASGLATNLSRQTFAFVIESALHEDPRYFPSQDKQFKLRVTNAFKQIFVNKTDAGHSSFGYGRVVSAFAAGQLVNAWQPGSDGSVGNGLERGVLTLGGDFAYNLAQEFFPFVRPKSIRHRD